MATFYSWVGWNKASAHRKSPRLSHRLWTFLTAEYQAETLWTYIFPRSLNYTSASPETLTTWTSTLRQYDVANNLLANLPHLGKRPQEHILLPPPGKISPKGLHHRLPVFWRELQNTFSSPALLPHKNCGGAQRASSEKHPSGVAEQQQPALKQKVRPPRNLQHSLFETAREKTSRAPPPTRNRPLSTHHPPSASRRNLAQTPHHSVIREEHPFAEQSSSKTLSSQNRDCLVVGGPHRTPLAQRHHPFSLPRSGAASLSNKIPSAVAPLQTTSSTSTATLLPGKKLSPLFSFTNTAGRCDQHLLSLRNLLFPPAPTC